MYEELTTLAPDLHCFESRDIPNGLGRRMTVMGLSGGRLAVHTGIDLDEPARLDALGRVAYVIVSNRMHTIEAPVLAKRYPEAVVLAPPSVLAKLKKQGITGREVASEWPAELAAEITCVPVGGTRMEESAFIHKASRTLVLTDLAFHFTPDDFAGLMRAGMRFNQALGGFGPSRIFRVVMLRDGAALSSSLKAILAHDFDRVVVQHGRVLPSGGPEAMRRAYRDWL